MENFIKMMLSDDKIVSIYQEIDKLNQFPANHGMKHILNVIGLSEKISSILNLKDREKLMLQTALVLHDIGSISGRENHGYKSMLFAEKYLQDMKLFSESELDEIYLAIKLHDECFDYSLLTTKLLWLVNLIDKLDFCKDRLEDNYRERFDYSVYEDIDHLEFDFNDNNFIIKIIKINNPKIISAENLFNRNLFSKAMLTFLLFCENFNYVPKVFLDGEELDLKTINKNVINNT